MKFSQKSLNISQKLLMSILWETYSAIEQLNEAAIGLQERVSRFQVNALQATDETKSYLNLSKNNYSYCVKS